MNNTLGLIKPSQAKPSQAKPSQAKPSQAKPTNIIIFILKNYIILIICVRYFCLEKFDTIGDIKWIEKQ